DGADAGAGLADVFGAVALRLQIPAVVVQVLVEGPLAGGLEGVHDARLAQLGPLHQFVEHQFRPRPVGRPGHGAEDAGGGAVLAVPLGGPQADAVALLREWSGRRAAVVVEEADVRPALEGNDFSPFGDGFSILLSVGSRHRSRPLLALAFAPL